MACRSFIPAPAGAALWAAAAEKLAIHLTAALLPA
jgi:hypothetical protein